MDIRFLTIQVIHFISPLQSLIFNVSQSHVPSTSHISKYQGGVQGKGMTFESDIVFVHRKGMAFKVRQSLSIKKGNGLYSQAWSCTEKGQGLLVQA